MRPRPTRLLLITSLFFLAGQVSPGRAEVTRDQVEGAIRRGVDFLKSQQQVDGTWAGEPGMSALATLALITAGESPESPRMVAALRSLVLIGDGGNHETYTLGLKLMALSTAPETYRAAIEAYANRLVEGQIRSPSRFVAGSWGYQNGGPAVGRSSDNSNAQYALLGLNAASEAGVKIPPIVWQRARRYWEDAQCRDGSWAYTSGPPIGGTGSMTCAGISSLIISGLKKTQSSERLVGDRIERCGESASDPAIRRGLAWLSTNFSVKQNINSAILWKYYYLYGLERAGRLSGVRFLGSHDWYREGAEELVRNQDPIRGYWRGSGQEADPVLATSFALLFLAKGRSPVLINKLRHGPGADWENDPDDVANLTNLVSRDWKKLVTWQSVDSRQASTEDLLQAPILFLNGHEAPVLSVEAKAGLRGFVENGGLILADACCGRREFDRAFRDLMKELFPGQENELHPLDPQHPVWRARYLLDPDAHPLWGIEQGCRTVVIYSPDDLSCYWQQMESEPSNPRVIAATHLGQNIIDYATGRELPADKLAAREMVKIGVDHPKRGALQIGKLKHGGDWNIAPMAIPNLTSTLRDKLKFDVVINQRELVPDDPNLVNYPLIYMHGRGSLSFDEPQLVKIRRHLSPGAGTLFADAACGNAAFDAAFRALMGKLYPDKPFEPIPEGDDLLTNRVGFDLSTSQLNKGAGGRIGPPALEGIRINGHWAVIYSKFDLGCALERHAGLDCKGYTTESALRIAANIVIYSTMP